MKKLILTINNDDVIIYLNNTKTTEDIINHLPDKVTLEMYDEREYYFPLDFKPSLEGERLKISQMEMLLIIHHSIRSQSSMHVKRNHLVLD